MSFRFKPEHFSKLDLIPDGEDLRLWVVIADQANRILRSYVKTLPEVFGYRLKESGLLDEHGPGWTMAEATTRAPDKDCDTHRARLWGMEEIKQKTCEHVAHVGDVALDMRGFIRAKCQDCGKRLVAKWQEAK